MLIDVHVPPLAQGELAQKLIWDSQLVPLYCGLQTHVQIPILLVQYNVPIELHGLLAQLFIT